MNRTRHLAALGAATLLIAAVVLAVRAMSRAHHAENQLAAAQRQHDAWAKTFADARARAARSSTNRLPAPAAPAVAPDDAVTNAAPVDARHERALRASAQLQFGRLLRSLALPPERADAFLHCIAEHNRALLLLSTATRDARTGVPPAIVSENARFGAELKALLGEQDYDKSREFERTQPLWSYVSALAVELYDGPTPFPPPQAEQLAGVLVTNATDAHGRLAAAPLDWDATLAQAAAFLSAPKLEMLAAIKDRRELQLRLNRMIGREARENH
jgi:hypothetical protein